MACGGVAARRGGGGQHLHEPGRAGKAEHAVDAGPPDVAIDEQDAEPVVRQGHGEVGRRERLALTGRGAGDDEAS